MPQTPPRGSLQCSPRPPSWKCSGAVFNPGISGECKIFEFPQSIFSGGNSKTHYGVSFEGNSKPHYAWREAKNNFPHYRLKRSKKKFPRCARRQTTHFFLIMLGDRQNIFLLATLGNIKIHTVSPQIKHWVSTYIKLVHLPFSIFAPLTPLVWHICGGKEGKNKTGGQIKKVFISFFFISILAWATHTLLTYLARTAYIGMPNKSIGGSFFFWCPPHRGWQILSPSVGGHQKFFSSLHSHAFPQVPTQISATARLARYVYSTHGTKRRVFGASCVICSALRLRYMHNIFKKSEPPQPFFLVAPLPQTPQGELTTLPQTP